MAAAAAGAEPALAVFPVSFGPASVGAALSIRRALGRLATNSDGLDAIFGGGGPRGASHFAEASTAFTAAANANAADAEAVQALVAAWVAASSTREAAPDLIAATLRAGIPVLGQRSGSRVFSARAAPKWVKASAKLRSLFSSVAEYGDAMEAVLLDYLPQVMAVMGGATPHAAANAAKKGKIRTAAGEVVAVLLTRETGEYVTVPESEKDAAIAERGLIDLRDQIELLRYAAFYTCRETSPPTILEGFTSTLTGWQYSQAEEDMLTALHFPIFDTELKALSAIAAKEEGGAQNEILEMQLSFLSQYFKDLGPSNVAFHDRKWGRVKIGGSGRASAEVARDLSLFYPDSISTVAIDHRKDLADVFTKDGTVKPAFSNFIKELSKKWEHLPTFEGKDIADHYLELYIQLRQKGADSRLVENIGRLLRANEKVLGDGAMKADATEGKLRSAPNFAVGFGARGSGDVVFAAPLCHDAYVPGTMDEKLYEMATPFLRNGSV